MDDRNSFVTGLVERRSEFEKRRNTVMVESRTKMVLGGLTVSATLFFLVKDRLKPPVTDLEEVHLRVWEVRRKQLFSELFTACLAIFFAYRVYKSYVPTNVEISNAILIKYLRMKNIIEDDIYSVLKVLKPYRVESLKL